MAQVELVRFAPVGTRPSGGFGGFLGAEWSGSLPMPEPVVDDVTSWAPESVRWDRRRWEFTTVFDLVGTQPDAVACRVWLPRVELRPDDYSGEQLVIWKDPASPLDDWSRTVFGSRR